jgi:hypothetical protein
MNSESMSIMKTLIDEPQGFSLHQTAEENADAPVVLKFAILNV